MPEPSSSPASFVAPSEQQPQSAAELARAARFALTLQRVAGALATPVDRSTMLTQVVQSSLQALDARAGAVAELSESGDTLHVVAAIGYPPALVEHFVHIRIGRYPAVAQVLAARAPVFVASQHEFELLVPEMAALAPPAGARAALPLETADRFTGVLMLTFAEPRVFTSDERDFMQAVAHHCAVALERASLFEHERRARAEAELASMRLSEALDRMSDLHFVCDADECYIQMNRAMRAFVESAGYDPDTLLGRRIADVFPKLVGGDMHNAMRRAVHEQTIVSFSARGTYADSWYEGHAYPFQGGVAVHAYDTTVQRRAEDEVARLTSVLKQRVDEMETLLKVIPVGIGIASDPMATEVKANPALATILRVSPDANASKTGPGADALPFKILQNGEEMPSSELPLQFAARTGQALPYGEHELLFGDGARVTLLASSAPIFDDAGRVRGSVGAFVDITARKRAEISSRILAEASAAFATSLDTGTTFGMLAQRVVPEMADVCVIFVVRESGSVGVVAMESTDAGMLEALRTFDRSHPVDGTPTHPVWHAIRDARSILVPNVNDASIASMLSGEQSVINLARETQTSSLLLVPITARGQVLGAVGMGTRGLRRRFDQGDLALAEELARRAGMALDNARLLAAEHRARGEAETARVEAERASRAKSDFLAMMSHELRTPLNAIAGYAELIELGLRGPVTDGQINDLQKIRQNQRHLLGLINSVLNFARLDAGRVLYDLTNVPVAASLRAVESLIEPQLRERLLSYDVTVCDPVVTARADSEKLQQILLNLLGNAIKFTPAGGRIHLSAEVAARDVTLHVADTGAGIPEDQFDRIFEPFVQVNRSIRSSKEGVGLGLAISRELARGMGGELTVSSTVGVGSTFSLVLPRAADRTLPT